MRFDALIDILAWRSVRTACVGVVVVAASTLVAVGIGPSTPTAHADAATTRPISDFLGQQLLNAPGGGDLVDWISDASNTQPSYRARVDFIGVIHEGFVKPNGGDFGTTFTGSVTEKARQDGRTDVHIVLHGENVFYFVGEAPGFNPIVSGRLAGAGVFAGLHVDTCSIKYDLKYITTNAPGQPMPRLGTLLFATPDDWEIVQSKLTAQGDSELRAAYGVDDGTRGRFTLNMNALIHPKGGDITTGDAFAVANISLHAVGSND